MIAGQIIPIGKAYAVQIFLIAPVRPTSSTKMSVFAPKCLTIVILTGFKFIKPNTHQHRRSVKPPREESSDVWHSLDWDIIGDDGLETNVRMNEDRSAQQGVQYRIKNAADERSKGERNESTRH